MRLPWCKLLYIYYLFQSIFSLFSNFTYTPEFDIGDQFNSLGVATAGTKNSLEGY